MGNRKLGNLGSLGNLGNIIPSFLISEFSISAVGQNRKLGFKNLKKKFPRFPRFPSFRSGRFFAYYIFILVYFETSEHKSSVLNLCPAGTKAA